MGIRATRLYIAMMLTFMMIVALQTSVSTRLKTVHRAKPTQQEFSRLHEQYSGNLSCPCSQVSVLHERIIKSSVEIYHPVRACRCLLCYGDKRFFFFEDLFKCFHHGRMDERLFHTEVRRWYTRTRSLGKRRPTQRMGFLHGTEVDM